MNELQMITTWHAIFALGKGFTYLLAMACMIKYLIA